MRATPTGYVFSAEEIIAAASRPVDPRASRVADLISYDPSKGWVVDLGNGEEATCKDMTSALLLASDIVGRS